MLTLDAIRRWSAHLERHLAEGTQYNYKLALRRFEDFAPKNLKDVTPEHIERFLYSLKSLTNRSVNGHLVALKSFFRTVETWWGMPNPAAKIKKLPTAPPKQRIFANGEVEKILTAANPAEKPILLFLLNTGLRASELQSIKEGDIGSDQRFLSVIGKGRRQRTIPLNCTAQAQIQSLMDLLKNLRKRNAIWNLCKRVSHHAGVPTAGPHSYRHYFADSLRKKGVPIYTISKLLGHSDLRTTEIYLHCSTEELLGTTDCLDK